MELIRTGSPLIGGVGGCCERLTSNVMVCACALWFRRSFFILLFGLLYTALCSVCTRPHNPHVTCAQRGRRTCVTVCTMHETVRQVSVETLDYTHLSDQRGHKLNETPMHIHVRPSPAAQNTACKLEPSLCANPRHLQHSTKTTPERPRRRHWQEEHVAIPLHPCPLPMSLIR